MIMSKKLLWLLILLVVVAAAVVAQVTKKPAEQGTIKVGGLFVLSGDGAAWGENAKKAVDLAVNDANRIGGINGRKIELISEDTGGEAKRAVSAYQKLVSIDNVDAVIGPLLQTEAGAIVPLVAKDGIPVVAPSYANLANRPVWYNPLFVWIDPTIEAQRIAEYVYQQGTRTVSIIGTKDAWESEVSSSFETKFKELGGRVLFKELVQPDARDMRLTITKAVNEKPQAIFLGTYYQFISSLKRLSELGFRGRLFSIEVDGYLAGETKDTSNKMQFIAPDFYTTDFTQKFEKIYREKPGIPAGQAYDAMSILINLLKNNTREAILKEMSNFKSYLGVSGEIEITPDHHTIFPTAIFEVNKGIISKVK